MNFRNALLSATLLALPVAASAQPITGLISVPVPVRMSWLARTRSSRAVPLPATRTRYAFWAGGRIEPWIRLWQWAQGRDRGRCHAEYPRQFLGRPLGVGEELSMAACLTCCTTLSI